MTRAARQRAVLLTQHGKETLIGPLIERASGCAVEHITGFDTDLLGTFSRDVPRAGTQLEAARRKARIGMELGKSHLGLASEGAFLPDPFMGVLSWNIEIVGHAEGPAQKRHRSVTSLVELRRFTHEAAFPAHALVLRPNDENDARLCKGINDWDTLAEAFQQARAMSRNGSVFVENDLRAHCNPRRQSVIRAATENLAKKLRSSCPKCQTPGYWIGGQIEGLPCKACRSPTREPLAQI